VYSPWWRKWWDFYVAQPPATSMAHCLMFQVAAEVVIPFPLLGEKNETQNPFEHRYRLGRFHGLAFLWSILGLSK
jgi:hypothetical protein